MLIGATTENPYFEVNAPLLSRSTLFRLEPLDDDDLRALAAARARSRGRDGRRRRASSTWSTWSTATAAPCSPRSRLRSPSAARVAPRDARARRGGARRPGAALRARRPLRRDLARSSSRSAGSDPDAGLYWLARMLTAGEDARFIARRLVILASEDIGMADPMALVVADAAAHAVEFVGLPEAAAQPGPGRRPSRHRAEAQPHRAGDLGGAATTWPSARRAGARAPARRLLPGGAEARPRGRLRLSARRSRRVRAQEYRPTEVADRRYYDPTDIGHEAEIAARQRARWGDTH